MLRLHEAATSGDIEKVKEYIAAGDDVNDMSLIATSLSSTMPQEGDVECYKTALHLAAYNGYTQLAKILIDAGADLDQQDIWQGQPCNTALEIAIQQNNIDLALMLKKSGARDDNDLVGEALSNRNIHSELLHAVLDDKAEVVRDIYNAGLLTQEDGEQALIYAAKHNAPKVAMILLVLGVSPNAYRNDETALGRAAENGHRDIAKLLLENGAEVDKYTSTSSYSDCTPLKKAIIRRGYQPSNPSLIALLLEYGAKLDKLNENDLIHLVKQGEPEDLVILLQNGFNPNSLCEGKPLLDRCLAYKKTALAMKLIEYGADVTFIDNEGRSYLHRSYDLKLTRLFVDKDLNIELNDQKGQTPIESVDMKSAEFLAEQGASVNNLTIHSVLGSPHLTRKLHEEMQPDFNGKDRYGYTPLYKLVKNAGDVGYLETLKVLLESNINIDINQATLTKGWTALHQAFYQNQGIIMSNADESVTNSRHTKAIDLLILNGAKPLKDKLGRTPLMCLCYDNKFNKVFNEALIKRYCKFESDYYGIPSELYARELLKFPGFRKDSDFLVFYQSNNTHKIKEIELFWESLDADKAEQRNLK